MIWRRSIKRNWMSLLFASCREGTVQYLGHGRAGHQCPWDVPDWVHSAAFPFLRWLHWGKAHTSCLLWSCHHLQDIWVIYVAKQQFIAVRAPKAEVIYLCVKLSCTQQWSVWPRVGRLSVQDSQFQDRTVILWHGHVPRGAGWGPLMLVQSACGSWPDLGMVAGSPLGWAPINIYWHLQCWKTVS